MSTEPHPRRHRTGDDDAVTQPLDFPPDDIQHARSRALWGGWLALATAAILATFGSFGVSFSIMSDCTNNYDCSDSCSPCDTAGAWLNSGWVIQGVLLLVAVVVVVAVTRQRLARAAFVTAVALMVLSVGSFIVTTSSASRSYCQPGEQVTLPVGQDNYCNY